LNNAREEGDFRNAPYVKSSGVKSILCMPLVNQDKLKAVVYLENNLTTHAFTPDRVRVLMAIASPAAVTLENAFMYNHLDDLVKKRTEALEAAQAEIAENAHKAGMSEIATTVLHNVGNVLNSLRTSGYVALETAKASKLRKLVKANALLSEEMDNIEDFIANNPKGKKLLSYYLELGEVLEGENRSIIENTQQVLSSTEAISEIINAQQKFAYTDASFSEIMPIEEVIESALTLIASLYDRHNIAVERRFESVPPISLHKSKVLHIILNLLKNAKESILTNGESDRKVTIAVRADASYLNVEVTDTGQGITEDNLKKIFTFGFTTKEDGHGSGLHSSANYMKEMGGKMWAESEGEGKGATFYLQFPLA
jgi:signal transduction histidine kinase